MITRVIKSVRMLNLIVFLEFYNTFHVSMREWLGQGFMVFRQRFSGLLFIVLTA